MKIIWSYDGSIKYTRILNLRCRNTSVDIYTACNDYNEYLIDWFVGIIQMRGYGNYQNIKYHMDHSGGNKWMIMIGTKQIVNGKHIQYKWIIWNQNIYNC